MRRRKYTYEFILSIINEHTTKEASIQRNLSFVLLEIFKKGTIRWLLGQTLLKL